MIEYQIWLFKETEIIIMFKRKYCYRLWLYKDDVLFVRYGTLFCGAELTQQWYLRKYVPQQEVRYDRNKKIQMTKTSKKTKILADPAMVSVPKQ